MLEPRMRLASFAVVTVLLACSPGKTGDVTPIDASTPDVPSGSFDVMLPDNNVGSTDTGCTTGRSGANRVPIDIIFAIDQSESMDVEIKQVKDNINKLAALLDATKLDYRVVMIARPGTDTFGVCVPPPLGADGCGDNLPRFKRSAKEVLSKDALILFLNTYDNTDPTIGWSKYVRPNAIKAFVPVTDDDATQPPPAPYWKEFDRQLLTRAGTMFGTVKERNYVFFPIIGADPANPTMKCSPDVVSTGIEYQELAKLTGGKSFSVCAADYGPVFTAMGKEILTRVLCSLPMPTPPAGVTLDTNRVNVTFTPTMGAPEDFVQDASKPCAEGANGWQYNADKTKVLLCGDVCKKVVDDPLGSVDVVFGCATKVR